MTPVRKCASSQGHHYKTEKLPLIGAFHSGGLFQLLIDLGKAHMRRADEQRRRDKGLRHHHCGGCEWQGNSNGIQPNPEDTRPPKGDQQCQSRHRGRQDNRQVDQ